MQTANSSDFERKPAMAPCYAGGVTVVARSTADATTTSSRSELITSFLPPASSIRIAKGWAQFKRPATNLESLAHHEAGHIVLMEWLGLTMGLRAAVSEAGGQAFWPPGAFDALPEVPPDPSGITAATAAAVYHAGLMAEMLLSGAQWQGPIFYPEALDYRCADDMLRRAFGRHASGAHAYAQKVALAVLQRHWGRVTQIAEPLALHGIWHSEPQSNLPN